MDRYTGKRLDGRYEIYELIGSGGMAWVYRAFDTIDDRVVAVKILKDEFAQNSEFLRRFRNESKAIAVLSHPNIVKVYDVSFGDRMQYIVMEYIDGITLKDYLSRQKEVKWKEAIHFTVQILRALQHAHDKGIIHRDIKPQNIMLLQDGTIKVTDFGIARFSRSETRTMTDKAIGSVHYIAPEQARGDVTDEKADIYSVGVMLYEMITGQLPFEADNAVSVAIMQLQTDPRPPKELNPQIPDGLQEITLKAMQKNPAKRYQSAAEMLRDIEEFKRNPSIVFEYKYMTDDVPSKYVDAISNVRGSAVPDYDDHYEYVEADAIPKPKSRTFLILTGVISAFVLVVAVVLCVVFIRSCSSNPASDTFHLPDFTGMNAADIVNDAQYEGKLSFVTETETDLSKGAGVVLRQSPSGNKEVKTGAEITLYVNSGAKDVELSDLSGYKKSEAESAVRELNLVPKLVEVVDDQTAAGYVVTTSPAGPSTVKEGTTVRIFISTGPATTGVPVPSVIGDDLETAKAKIVAAGLVVGTNVVEKDDTGKEAGIVVDTDPLPGVSLSKGSTVTLTVSSGKNSVRKIEVFVNLPAEIDEDMTLKIYKGSVFYKEETVHPSFNSTVSYIFEGDSGKENVIFQLNGQVILTVEIDYDAGVSNVRQENAYVPTTKPTPTPEGGVGHE